MNVVTTDAYAYLNVNDPVCAWATYRGVLVSVAPDGRKNDLTGGISLLSAGLLRSGSQARLSNELVIEGVRRLRHAGRVSRLQGMYCFLDKDSAERAAALWGSFQNHFRPEFLAELHLETSSRRDRLDSNWITYARRDPNGFILEDEIHTFDRYWSGDEYPGKVPIWETLIEGRLVILGTELRNRAYEIIKGMFPRSLALLEIARQAAWVGSDLGNTRAWLQDQGDKVALRYLLDMRDADNAQFLEKIEQLKNEGHPINWNDLHAEMRLGSFGQTPDLRPYEILRAKSELPFLRAAQSNDEHKEMTNPPLDYIRLAGRLSAIENLLSILIFDRARLNSDPASWVRQYISNLRRGVNMTSFQPIDAQTAERLREETHRALLEFADLVEAQLAEAIQTKQIVEPESK